MASPVRGPSLARAGLFGSLAASLAAATMSLACAQPAAGTSAPKGVDVRILVKLVQPSDDSQAIATQASHAAGVPVGYAASVSSSWHSLSVHCVDAAACEAAIARLRQNSAYAAVEPDGRKQRAVM